MKLKATLSDRGIRVLEKGFLPTFEKLGKRLVLLLGPDDIQIIQAMAEAEGLHIAARLAKVRGDCSERRPHWCILFVQ